MWYRSISPHFSECCLLCTLLQHLYEFVAVDFLLDSPFVPDSYYYRNTVARRKALLAVIADIVRPVTFSPSFSITSL